MADWQLLAGANGRYQLDNGIKGAGRLCVPAIIGKAGLIAANAKREGDMATPVGRWALRHLYYRQDVLGKLSFALPSTPITRKCGWCDDPSSPHYNQYVKLKFDGSAETMWREDGAYDLVVILGYNDAPPIAGRGSAIFLHCISRGKTVTAGCVALARDDLLRYLEGASVGQFLLIPDLPIIGG
jgi:L,D-peptidoglycan transpeptidase YkuD (ErfK/YbiS/YcfS/YnhG family)